jgi:hypothetical protein
VHVSGASVRLTERSRGCQSPLPPRPAELQGLLDRLVRLLDAAGVPFMIAGSFASAAHGLPRTTQDFGTGWIDDDAGRTARMSAHLCAPALE